MEKIEGIVIPAVTPFGEDGDVRFDLMEKNYSAWNKTDVCGYMCLGSNGEFRMLDDDESFGVIKAAAEFTAPDKKLIIGVGRESLIGTLRFIDRIEAAGIRADYLSVLTPHYFKGLMTDRALVEYFTAIADRSAMPILLYCAPGFANTVCISSAALKELADHPNIHGIKDTSPDMMDEYMAAVGGRNDFMVLAGSINTTLACLDKGGSGGIASAANYLPQECADFVRIYREDGRDKAVEYIAALKAVVKATGGRGSVAGVKCAMNILGLGGGFPRRPILPVDKKTEEEMRQAFIDGGYLKA
jgi:4-hydroxy-2-oxoglutarate aldolase